jgi:hypothetical protein
MVERNTMADEDAELDKQSFLVVKFAGMGSALFEASFNNVVPTQILAVSQYLDIKARNAILQEEVANMRRKIEEEDRTKLIVPGTKILVSE